MCFDRERPETKNIGRKKLRNTWCVRRWLFLLTFVLGSGNLLGCAFVDRRVTLTPPTTTPQTFSTSASSSDKKEISIARPQDLRPDPTTVGNVRNGYGMVTASVRSNTDIPMWVTNSIIQGLERSGFSVERAETVETAPTPVALDIAVSRAFTEHAPGFFTMKAKGDVAAQVEVYKDGRRIHRRTYAGKIENPEFFVMTSANEYQTLLDAAMKDFLQKTLPDLVRVLDQALEESSQE